MVLQGSGVITLSDIRGEFGGAAPDLLSEYYRGGGLVPDTPANAGIPTSGTILLSDFYGGDASVGSVTVTDPVSVSRENPTLFCAAGVEFVSDGGLDEIGPGTLERTPYNAGEWWSEEPSVGIGTDYDVRCASISSADTWNIAAAATGSWVNISTNPVWRCNVIAMASPDIRQVTASFEIRIAGGGATVATFTVNATAQN